MRTPRSTCERTMGAENNSRGESVNKGALFTTKVTNKVYSQSIVVARTAGERFEVTRCLQLASASRRNAIVCIKDSRTPSNGHTYLELRRTCCGKMPYSPQVGIVTHSYPYVTVLYRLNADSDG